MAVPSPSQHPHQTPQSTPPRPAFLFDLDGVLIDSREFHWQSWEKLQDEVPAFRTTYGEFLRTFGQRNDQILRDKIPQSTPEQRTQWAERKEEIFRSLCRGKLKLLPGMEDFLTALEQKGLPKIIASSTPLSNLQFFLQTTELGRFFKDYVSGDEVPKGKPFPDIFLEAARRLGHSPVDCLVLEDSLAGLEAGKAAQCFVLALATTHSAQELPRNNYDVLYSSPRDLQVEEVLHQWRQKHRT